MTHPQRDIFGTIAVEGIEVFGYHGVYAQEQTQGSQFLVDVYAKAPISAAANTDSLIQTVDYQGIYQLVLEIMQDRSDLLETLAMRIGTETLRAYEAVKEVRVRVSKLRPLGMEQSQRTFVEIQLSRHVTE